MTHPRNITFAHSNVIFAEVFPLNTQWCIATTNPVMCFVSCATIPDTLSNTAAINHAGSKCDSSLRLFVLLNRKHQDLVYLLLMVFSPLPLPHTRTGKIKGLFYLCKEALHLWVVVFSQVHFCGRNGKKNEVTHAK